MQYGLDFLFLPLFSTREQSNLFLDLPFAKFKEEKGDFFLLFFDLAIFKVSLEILPQTIETAVVMTCMEIPYKGSGGKFGYDCSI